MPVLHARLLGELEFRDDAGGEVKLATRKSRALLAYLIIEGDRWHTRERLAGLLWSDRQPAQARHSLTQALSSIRKLGTGLGAQLIETEGDRVRVGGEDVVSADVRLLRRHADRAPERAADHFSGPLLDGFVSGDESFDEWAANERASLQGQVCRILEAAVQAAADQGQFEIARDRALQWAVLEPFSEAAHREAMRRLAALGDKARAVQQFQICERILRDELEVAPSSETRALLNEVRSAEEKLDNSYKVSPAPVGQPSQPKLEAVPEDLLSRIATPDSIERQNLVGDQPEAPTPIIAVMPFVNLSDDPGSDYFAEGLADDVLFGLSSFKWFKVLGRAATFRIAEMGLSASQLNQVLGATHLVSGSMRRQGQRVRLSVELTDCQSNHQIWSEQFDEALDNVFDVEDRVVAQVVSAIVPALELSEIRKVLRRTPNSLSAYELLQRGNSFIYRNQSTTNADDEARRCFEAAIALDPDYASAYAALAYVKYRGAFAYIASTYLEHMEDARQTALQALSIEPNEPQALRYLGATYSMLRDQDAALTALRRSIEVCPSYATAYTGIAFVYDYRGEFDAAIPAVEETIRLRPHDPILHRCVIAKSIASYQTGDYVEAEKIARNSLRTNDKWWMSNLMLAASLGQTGKPDEGRRIVDHIKETYSGLSLDKLMNGMPFVVANHQEHLRDGLAKAGWTDEPVYQNALSLEPPAIAIKKLPAIAVMPFKNLSADPDQKYFAEGIAEDLAQALARVRTFNVYSHGITSEYADDRLDAARIGTELGVQYIVEGSVRRSQSQIRVSARLISASTGAQIWAERYDGCPEDVFELQDSITDTIAGTIEPELVRAEGQRLHARRPENMAAYDWLLKGLSLMHKLTEHDTRAALECFEQAIEADSTYARAHAFASWCYRRRVQQGGLTLSDRDRSRAVVLARQALQLDRSDPYVLVYSATTIEWLEQDFDEALALYERALELTPTSHRFWNAKASVLSRVGRTQEAIEAAEKAIALSPREPAIWVAYWAMAEAHFQEQRYEQAIHFAKQALRHNENVAPAHHILAAASAHLERWQQARSAIARAILINPDLTLMNFGDLYPIARLKNLEGLLEGLKLAGLPERVDSSQDDRPSIAVLPFEHLSDDPDQRVLADGLADDIINTLSKVSKMRVIARNSSFALKGRSMDVREIAEKLGVRYVLEGSVRKSGSRLRVTAQLIDTADGVQIWADRFDRRLEDLFDIQDEITKDVVTALQVALTDGEKAHVLAKGTRSIAAWRYCVQARELEDKLTATHHLEARALAEKAIEINPDYAYAWGILGFTYFRDGRMDLGASKAEKLARAQEIAERAVALDPSAPWGVGLTAMVSAAMGQHDRAIADARKAVELQPGSAEVRAFSAYAFAFSGLYAEAAEQTRIALSLDPFAPSWYHMPLVRSWACRERFEEALGLAEDLLAAEPALVPTRIWQIYCLDAVGQAERARASVIELKRHAPHIRTDHIDGIVCLADRELTQRIIAAHRRAGLSDVVPKVIDRPSIAVMPFDNLSSDPDHEFLADGMADDISTGLAKFRSLVVIARGSSFSFKGQQLDVREIAKRLDVRYVVEGSLRVSGDAIRVTANLVEAETGKDIWAERFHEKLVDVFDVQDKITDAIVRAISPEISHAEIVRARRRPPEDLDAWALYLKGVALHPSGNIADFDEAIALFDESYQTDPSFADAAAMAALMRARKVFFFGHDDREQLINKAREQAQAAMRADPKNANGYAAMARLFTILREPNSAIEMCREALELNPNALLPHFEMAVAHSALEEWEKAIKYYDAARRLSPRDPHITGVFAGRAHCFFELGRYEECVESARIAARGSNPRYWSDTWRIASLLILGRSEEAAAAKRDLLRKKPDFTISSFRQLPWVGDEELLVQKLREAGLPQ